MVAEAAGGSQPRQLSAPFILWNAMDASAAGAAGSRAQSKSRRVLPDGAPSRAATSTASTPTVKRGSDDLDLPRSPPRVPARLRVGDDAGQSDRFEALDSWSFALSAYLEEIDHAFRMVMAKVTFMEGKGEARQRETQQAFNKLNKIVGDLDKQEKSNKNTISECAQTLRDAVAVGFPEYHGIDDRVKALETMPKPPGLEDDVIRDVRQRFDETTAEQNQIKADLATFGNLAHDALTKLQESENMVNANFN